MTILPRVDRWLCTAFAPHRVAQTIDQMFADQPERDHDAKAEMARMKIEEVEAKLGRYRAVIEAADLVKVLRQGGWPGSGGYVRRLYHARSPS